MLFSLFALAPGRYCWQDVVNGFGAWFLSASAPEDIHAIYRGAAKSEFRGYSSTLLINEHRFLAAVAAREVSIGLGSDRLHCQDSFFLLAGLMALTVVDFHTWLSTASKRRAMIRVTKKQTIRISIAFEVNSLCQSFWNFSWGSVIGSQVLGTFI